MQRTSPLWFSLYAAIVAFLLYTCVYGFRKTFSVATFENVLFLGISYKVWLVTAQVAGYALSKFIGIKVVSEMKSGSRFRSILLLIGLAGFSWLLFALVPAPYNIFFLFMNGLPLGMIWGLIFSYLEGRQTTDLLGAGLSVSFIFSSGFTKTVGATLMHQLHISETWMPFAACCFFFAPLLFFLWLLDQLPPPNETDQHERTVRQPMNGRERVKFALTFAPGLVLLISAYLLLTSFRDFRDNFTTEIWAAMGYTGSPERFTVTEIPIAIVVLLVMGSLVLVKNNRFALLINHFVILTGFVLIGVSTYLFQRNEISPMAWVVATGLGLYLGYVPFNCIFFERLIAAFKYVSTVGFVMYLADSFGYLGSVGVLFYKEFGQASLSWLEFFQQAAITISMAGAILMTGSFFYFERKLRRSPRATQMPAKEVLA